MDRNVTSYDLTRPWRDGGRDAIGKYKIGLESNAIYVEFALEAKCKNTKSGSGVRELSRLISRLRYRQFGVFITTSYVSHQAYEEITTDAHPIIILSGIDIVNILVRSGYNSKESIKQWLEQNF